MLNWSKKFNIFCFLDSHDCIDENSRFKWMFATMPLREMAFSDTNSLCHLDDFIEAKPCWLFGHLGFPLQQNIYGIANARPARISFGDAYLFEPGIVIQLSLDNRILVYSGGNNSSAIIEEIEQVDEVMEEEATNISIDLRSAHNVQSYNEKIDQIKSYINRGDFYELNYCYEFSGNGKLDVLKTLYKLSSASPNPFGAFYKLNHNYCFCASPERFLQKTGSTIISQPIKGTQKRDLQHAKNDLLLKEEFGRDEKNRSENIMIVDLVRNDLSRVALKNSVEVEKLCEVKTFPNLHHLISTIKARLKPGIRFSDILKATFPMGSMTGAPKRKVLEITSLLEATDRGLYSGSIGYFEPEGNFDFNVVIRTLFYNQQAELFSFWIGGGITSNSLATEEYEETLVKGEAIIKLLKET